MPGQWRPPTLATERLILRPLDDGDAPNIFAYASSPTLTRYTLWESHKTIDDTFTFLREYAASRYLEHVPDPLGVCLKESPAVVIGTVGAFWANRVNLAMEMGYVLSEAHHGRGLMTEAARAIIDHVFAHYECERLQAHCFAENAPSLRVMEKAGMKIEGKLRSAVLKKNQFHDIIVCSIIRSEWQSSGGHEARDKIVIPPLGVKSTT